MSASSSPSCVVARISTPARDCAGHCDRVAPLDRRSHYPAEQRCQGQLTMNRTLDIPPEKLTPEQATVFNRLVAGRGRILGPYKVWIHSPDVASGMEHIGTFLNKHSSLSAREVEMCIL